MPRARPRRARGRIRRASRAPGRSANSSTGRCIGPKSSTDGPRSATSRERSSRRSARRRTGSRHLAGVADLLGHTLRRRRGVHRVDAGAVAARRERAAARPTRGRGVAVPARRARPVWRLRWLNGGRVVKVGRAPHYRVPMLSVAAAGRDGVHEQAAVADDRRREAVVEAVENTLMNPKVVPRALTLVEAEIVRDGTAARTRAAGAADPPPACSSGRALFGRYSRALHENWRPQREKKFRIQYVMWRPEHDSRFCISKGRWLRCRLTRTSGCWSQPRAALARRSSSCGETSSTCVANHHWLPHGSFTQPCLSP